MKIDREAWIMCAIAVAFIVAELVLSQCTPIP